MFTFTRSCWGMSCMISFCGHWSVFLKQNTARHSLCASLPFILHHANLGQTGVTHRFSPWLTWTWQGRERVSFVLESMEEALGFCGDWWRHRERWQGEGKKERQNKMKRLTYRVKRLCWQRWMVGLKAGGLGEINNLCVCNFHNKRDRTGDGTAATLLCQSKQHKQWANEPQNRSICLKSPAVFEHKNISPKETCLMEPNFSGLRSDRLVDSRKQLFDFENIPDCTSLLQTTLQYCCKRTVWMKSRTHLLIDRVVAQNCYWFNLHSAAWQCLCLRIVCDELCELIIQMVNTRQASATERAAMLDKHALVCWHVIDQMVIMTTTCASVFLFPDHLCWPIVKIKHLNSRLCLRTFIAKTPPEMISWPLWNGQ